MPKYHPRLPAVAKRGQSRSSSGPPAADPAVTVPNGKPAWEGAMQPDSGGDVKEYTSLASAAHRRWLRKNQVQDVESSLRKDGQGGFTASSAANIVLYVGLGMVAIGLIITFVGLGERGFQTDELKLIGPCLICSGLLFCLLRVFFCTVGAGCCRGCCKLPEDRSTLITPQRSRARTATAAVARPSRHPNFVSDGEDSEDAAAGALDPDGEISHVPILPPIKGGKGQSTSTNGEVLLDPMVLGRPPSGGSVMEPLTPARRRNSTVQIEHEIDDMIK